MNGLCYLGNVVYQAIINPKEDISDRDFILAFRLLVGKLDMEIINFPSPMSIKKNQTALSKHYWGLKDKGLTPTYNGPYWKDLVPQNLSIVGATCVLKKKSTFCFFLSKKNY